MIHMHPITARAIAGIALALAGSVQAASSAENTPGAARPPKMQYQVGYSPLEISTGKINAEADRGWRLKSASPVPCPALPGFRPGAPCVFVVLEREQ